MSLSEGFRAVRLLRWAVPAIVYVAMVVGWTALNRRIAPDWAKAVLVMVTCGYLIRSAYASIVVRTGRRSLGIWVCMLIAAPLIFPLFMLSLQHQLVLTVQVSEDIRLNVVRHNFLWYTTDAVEQEYLAGIAARRVGTISSDRLNTGPKDIDGYEFSALASSGHVSLRYRGEQVLLLLCSPRGDCRKTSGSTMPSRGPGAGR